MKPKCLLAKYSLFQNDTLEQKYEKIKNAFIFLLDRTVERCTKYCEHRNDQERYATVCSEAIPGLSERRALIASSKECVLFELKKINELNSAEQKINALETYARGLANTQFNGLFMVIFSGQLKKRWFLIEEEPNPAEENPASNGPNFS